MTTEESIAANEQIKINKEVIPELPFGWSAHLLPGVGERDQNGKLLYSTNEALQQVNKFCEYLTQQKGEIVFGFPIPESPIQKLRYIDSPHNDDETKETTRQIVVVRKLSK